MDCRAIALLLASALQLACAAAPGDAGDQQCDREPGFLDPIVDGLGTRVDLELACQDPCFEDFSEQLEAVEQELAQSSSDDADAPPCIGVHVSGCGVDTIQWALGGGLSERVRNYDTQTGRLIGAGYFDDTAHEVQGCEDFEFHGGMRRPDCPDETRTSLCPPG